MRTFVTTIERLRGYISVCKHLRDGRDIIYCVQQYVATAVPVVLIYLSAENKMWEQYPFCKLACFWICFLPLRSTVPFIQSCVTWEKYFTARCAQPLQAVVAHLTAVYHSCAGYSIFKFLICPSTYRELGEAFCIPISHNFHIDLYSCTIVCAFAAFILNKKTVPVTVIVTSTV